jgi:transcriptional regulator with XRE-family HTH domain
MYDNIMISISEQIKQRRVELGLSLSAVARRAGTSAATLSRYENGWSRFEVQTLHKLATALDCDLQVALQPRSIDKISSPDRARVAKQLRRLFWDHPLKPQDLDVHTIWVVERVLEYGQLADVHLLRDYLGLDAFWFAVQEARFTSEKARNFWEQMLQQEGRSCTRAFSRHIA